MAGRLQTPCARRSGTAQCGTLSTCDKLSQAQESRDRPLGRHGFQPWLCHWRHAMPRPFWPGWHRAERSLLPTRGRDTWSRNTRRGPFCQCCRLACQFSTLRPLTVHIRATNTSLLDLYEHLIGADLGHWELSSVRSHAGLAVPYEVSSLPWRINAGLSFGVNAVAMALSCLNQVGESVKTAQLIYRPQKWTSPVRTNQPWQLRYKAEFSICYVICGDVPPVQPTWDPTETGSNYAEWKAKFENVLQ